MDTVSYRGFRFPPEVISHCVWLYHRFSLSLRDVEELMFERGIEVSHETVHYWTRRFGPAYANALRRYRPRPGDKWHLGEVFVKVQGVQKYLWRAVDQDGNVLDILLQNHRDGTRRQALLPETAGQDPDSSSGHRHRQAPFLRAAHRTVMPSVEHRSHKGLNNRAENSHQPTRQRERAMKGFPVGRRGPKVPVRVQRHLTHSRPRRHPPTASRYRLEMLIRFAVWNHITGTAVPPNAA
ncbi:IS6 family transposase [Streptomyces sp. NPDC059534]|uniref:IS6 family transposase n=1 Tax=Streptomyces sp. NPDC059534 TaxID=3346859 RepID=UPI0036C82787